MKYVPGNCQHIGSRKTQEDSFGFTDPDDLSFRNHGGFLAILADGAGGMEHGGAASRMAVKAFLENYAAKVESEPISTALERCLARANEAVHALAIQRTAEENVATTLVAAALFQDKLHWISVGDSALYLYRAGALSLLTSSHTYAQELDQKAALGFISIESAMNHPDRDALTSYVGSKSPAVVDRSAQPLALTTQDRILLASDGLFKSLNQQEICAELSLHPQQACESLVEKVLAKALKYQDNVTVLCIAVENEDDQTIRISADRSTTPRKRFWVPWRK
jgi:protein phosphatase